MFYKISANGNDFILLNAERDFNIERYQEVYKDVDGLIALCSSSVCDANYRVYNKDGSLAKICGNGLLAATCYLEKVLHRRKSNYIFLTDNGFYAAGREENNYYALFERPKIISYDRDSGLVDAGNLHQISLVEHIDPEKMVLEKELLQKEFNLHQLQRRSKNFYLMVSLERGVGFTKCCGSGAVAAFCYLSQLGQIEDEVCFQTLGGMVKVSRLEDKIKLQGRVKIIYQGELYEDEDHR